MGFCNNLHVWAIDWAYYCFNGVLFGTQSIWLRYAKTSSRNYGGRD